MTDQIVREMESEMTRQAEEAERFNAAVAANLDYLWARCISPKTAEKLAADFEILINNMGEVISAIAYARSTGDREFASDCLIGLLDRELRKIAEFEAKEAQP